MHALMHLTFLLGVAAGLIVTAAAILSRLFREIVLAFTAAAVCALYIDGGAERLATGCISFVQSLLTVTDFGYGFALGMLVVIAVGLVRTSSDNSA